MNISPRERRLLLLLALVALVVLASALVPAVGDWNRARQQHIADLLLALEREQALIEGTADWAERRSDVEMRESEMEIGIFSGATIPLIEAAIQQDLLRYARESGLTVNSTRLAERLEGDRWLLIRQEMSFHTADADRTIAFLDRLAESLPRLRVTDFSVNRSRTQYTGSITVVGFARPATAQQSTQASRQSGPLTSPGAQ